MFEDYLTVPRRLLRAPERDAGRIALRNRNVRPLYNESSSAESRAPVHLFLKLGVLKAGREETHRVAAVMIGKIPAMKTIIS